MNQNRTNCLVISFLMVIIFTVSHAQITRDQCYLCHSNSALQKIITTSSGTEIIPLYVDSVLYNQNTHHSLECVECHSDINQENLFSHSLAKTYGSWARFSKSDTTLNLDNSPRTRNYYTTASMSCTNSGCHETKAGFDSTRHHTIWRLKTARVHTVNGESVGENYDKTCSRCHTTCATCHFNSVKTQAYIGDVLAIWDSLQTLGEGPFPNAGKMTEWSMDWTTNVQSHEFVSASELQASNDVCRSCHVGFYKPPVYGFITEEAPFTKAKATNIKRHPQFYESAQSPNHQTLHCAQCHTDVHSYPDGNFDWQTNGDVVCSDCHAMTDHFPQHTTVDCISCHATGFGRSQGQGDDVHDVFRSPVNNRVRPLAVKYNEGLSWYPHIIETPDTSASCASKCHYQGNLLGATVFPTSIIVNGAVPLEFSLQQNYPNPFNPGTIISFDLPVSAPVYLTVYDALGRKVTNLIKGENLKAGSHAVHFDAKNLASGLYIYRLEADTYTSTKKMILIR